MKTRAEIISEYKNVFGGFARGLKKVNGVNFVTPDLLGYVLVDNVSVEITTNFDQRLGEVYGVTYPYPDPRSNMVRSLERAKTWVLAMRVLNPEVDWDGDDLTPGCYIEGHHGQYATDRLIELFGNEKARKEAAKHREEDDFDSLVYLADDIEREMGNIGVNCQWVDGEFFIGEMEGEEDE